MVIRLVEFVIRRNRRSQANGKDLRLLAALNDVRFVFRAGQGLDGSGLSFFRRFTNSILNSRPVSSTM